MPTFQVTQRFPYPREQVFAFFRRPANVLAVAPPGASFTLIEGPEILQPGSRIKVRMSRWGIALVLASEVVELIEPERLVEEQRQGPFRAWRHERVFAVVGEGETDVAERIDYEPPGGMLGLTLTAQQIEADLVEAFAWRHPRVLAMLASVTPARGGQS